MKMNDEKKEAKEYEAFWNRKDITTVEKLALDPRRKKRLDAICKQKLTDGFYFPNENGIYIDSIEKLKSTLNGELSEIQMTGDFKVKADLVFNHIDEIKQIFSEYREKFQHS